MPSPLKNNNLPRAKWNLTQILPVSSLVSLHIEKGKSIIDPAGSRWAEGAVGGLAVASYEESMGNRTCSWLSWRTLQSIRARGSV